ncbi:MAG: hypothetical protein NDI69_02610 [Bacteriovoracaceae bacterium]|nr:hypothetical protein [Bacteriovoracaceae bacterium]
MRTFFLFLFLSFFINESSLSQNKVNLPASFDKSISDELKPFFTPSEGQIEDLLKGEVISIGKVDSPSPQVQQMFLFVAGVHPRNCTRAMRKLSLYENYHQYMDFVKTSTYNEKTNNFSFTIDHVLLPFPMVVNFKIPRIKKEGYYPFIFESGFLKDLKGTVIVQEMGKYCVLGLKADWRGPKSRIPDLIFGTFIQTVGKLGLEHLIRISYF